MERCRLWGRSLLMAAGLGLLGTVGSPLGANPLALPNGTYLAQATSSAPQSALEEEDSSKEAEEELSGKERKERKNFTSKSGKSTKRERQRREGAGVEFIDSEEGFWNSRSVDAPLFVEGGSVNSVMFENRPSRRVQEIPEGPVRESEVEFTGGKSTEITINGRKVEIPAAQRQEEDSGQKLESGLEEEADSKLPSEERQP